MNEKIRDLGKHPYNYIFAFRFRRSMPSYPSSWIRSSVLIASTYIMTFLIGIYVAHYWILNLTLKLQRAENSLVTHAERKANVFSYSETFQDIGKKYGTDKVTSHHYDSLYEKYLKKYRGSHVSLLEIGLGCGMQYGPGKSAYVWRDYFGPLANIHIMEYNQICGDNWYRGHGNEVIISISSQYINILIIFFYKLRVLRMVMHSFHSIVTDKSIEHFFLTEFSMRMSS